MSKTGVLLINLGTPDNPDVSSVRRYLNQFLSDERVLDIPWLVRQILLKCLILPFRSPKSAKAYQAIWDKKRGSPLLYHSLDLAKQLQIALGDDFQVELGMRYGNPSIDQAISNLAKNHCQKIIALPLFPQYSSAASGSAIEAVLKNYAKKWNLPSLTVIDKFYDNEDYLTALSGSVHARADSHVIFSYHSLPVRQIQKSSQACQQTCFENTPCPAIKQDTHFCYRAQCYETSRQVAQRCEIDSSRYTVVFQSRLGRTVWVGPDLQSTFATLIQKGVKDLTVVCPSFVADCLETLEEIGIRAKEEWLKMGGKSLHLNPCLNADPMWVKALVGMVNRAV